MISEKYGRTYHYPFSPGTTSDDRINHTYWEDIQRIKTLVHTEKLDGENITGGHFLAGKHINDAETRFVGQRFENGGKFFVTRFVIHKILFSAEIP